ncbi:MAG: tRNA (adenosine(37)-N6)-threonylcarbamoyltransferase complex dimerization subunit type 1 TsaB [Clostridia bacterium]|nr:tRNA (adenosine(37)-N6)-threonylcarbamoyltransferase complex dimerization subunit type 1 TsaB [Clostridia bacterium]
MIIMAFDSTAKSASVSVLDGERVLAVYNVDNGLTQSELLLPMAEDILKSLKLKFSDVGLFACSVGPGSFTGVRIGVSLVKGLAFGRNVPCAAVSTLEALAENLNGLKGLIVPVMDARRGQVYGAIYESSENGLNCLVPDGAFAISELADMLRDFSGMPIYLVGDGYEVAKRGLSELGINTESTPELLVLENAASVGKIALRKYERGECTTDLEIAPTYLRMPQAERERLEREKQNG